MNAESGGKPALAGNPAAAASNALLSTNAFWVACSFSIRSFRPATLPRSITSACATISLSVPHCNCNSPFAGPPNWSRYSPKWLSMPPIYNSSRLMRWAFSSASPMLLSIWLSAGQKPLIRARRVSSVSAANPNCSSVPALASSSTMRCGAMKSLSMDCACGK
ncbi:hypothetical protein D3C84_956970 [compost metagenome]